MCSLFAFLHMHNEVAHRPSLLIKQVLDSGCGLTEHWICLFACGGVSDFEVEIRQISVNWQRPVQTDTPPHTSRAAAHFLRTKVRSLVLTTLGLFKFCHWFWFWLVCALQVRAWTAVNAEKFNSSLRTPNVLSLDLKTFATEWFIWLSLSVLNSVCPN